MNGMIDRIAEAMQAGQLKPSEDERIRLATDTLAAAAADLIAWHGLHSPQRDRGRWIRQMDERLYRLHVALAAYQKELGL